MGAAEGAVAGAESADWATGSGSPADTERDIVGTAHRGTVAGLTGAVRFVVNGVQPVSALGSWDAIFAAVQQEADAAGELDWEIHYVDSTVVRAHQHAAGAKGGTLRSKH